MATVTSFHDPRFISWLHYDDFITNADPSLVGTLLTLFLYGFPGVRRLILQLVPWSLKREWPVLLVCLLLPLGVIVLPLVILAAVSASVRRAIMAVVQLSLRRVDRGRLSRAGAVRGNGLAQGSPCLTSSDGIRPSRAASSSDWRGLFGTGLTSSFRPRRLHGGPYWSTSFQGNIAPVLFTWAYNSTRGEPIGRRGAARVDTYCTDVPRGSLAASGLDIPIALCGHRRRVSYGDTAQETCPGVTESWRSRIRRPSDEVPTAMFSRPVHGRFRP